MRFLQFIANRSAYQKQDNIITRFKRGMRRGKGGIRGIQKRFHI